MDWPARKISHCYWSSILPRPGVRCRAGPDALQAGAVQPGQQCHQVHRARPGTGDRRPAAGNATGARALMQVQVHDSGIGISQQDQQRLFEPFAQADNTAAIGPGWRRTGPGDQPQPVRNDGRQPAIEQRAGDGHAGGRYCCILQTLPLQPTARIAETQIVVATTPAEYSGGRRSLGQSLAHLPATGVSRPSFQRCGGWSEADWRGMAGATVRSGHRRLQHAGHERL